MRGIKQTNTLNKEQALQRLIQVVSKGARHPWYERTTELADLYRKLVTGDGLDNLLRQFVQRESADAFKERVKLTQHVVTTVTKNIMDVFYKVPRSNYQRILEHLGDNSERMTAELEESCLRFGVFVIWMNTCKPVGWK